MLTEDDLTLYSIEDVVYPIPGHRTVYPKNEVGDIYRDLLGKSIHMSTLISWQLTFPSYLEKDQIVFDKSEQYMKWVTGYIRDGLKEKDTKHISNARDLAGDYRPMLAKADDLEWSLIRYDDPCAPLCYTDLDRIVNKDEATNIPGKWQMRKFEEKIW